MSEQGDDKNDDSGGDAGGLEPARPGNGLSCDFFNEGHADGVGAHGCVKKPGVCSIGVEV